MTDAIEFALDDGTTVAVASPPRVGSGAVGLSDRLEAAEKTLREALGPVTAAAEQMIDGFREMARRPEEIELSFGVTLDGKLGGVIASANAGAHLEVTLRWRGSDARGKGVLRVMRQKYGPVGFEAIIMPVLQEIGRRKPIPSTRSGWQPGEDPLTAGITR